MYRNFEKISPVNFFLRVWLVFWVTIMIGYMPIGAYAIPSLVDHSHMGTITWSERLIPPNIADSTNHQHQSDRNLLDNPEYSTYTSWDNELYRTLNRFGHGFIEKDKSPDYNFSSNVPVKVQNLINSAFDAWESKARANNNRPDTITGLYFDQWALGETVEIQILWEDIDVAGHWNISRRELRFDSNPKLGLKAPPGYLISNGGLNFTQIIRFDTQWNFNITEPRLLIAKQDVDFQNISTGQINESIPIYGTEIDTIDIYELDFYTIALHETGHVIGLYDFNGTNGIMHPFIVFVGFEDPFDFFGGVTNFREPDADSLMGATDLYTIPRITTVESSNASGKKNDTFLEGMPVYAFGGGYDTGKTYDLYVVMDRIWNSGNAIKPYIVQTAVSTDAEGNISPHPKLIWNSAVIGKYDIIVDINRDGNYSEGIDALDDLDVGGAGFVAIPEFPTIVLPVAAVIGMMFLIFRRRSA